MSVRADIMEVARVLEDAAAAPKLTRYLPAGPLGADAGVYAGLMPALSGHPGVQNALALAEFRPFFLVNGLLLATSLPRAPMSALLETLSIGLLEFADHFERLASPGAAVDDAARALQTRYFAYCAAELVERGMPLTGVFATMKGDALETDTAYDIRAWIEEGPQAMLSSPLVTPRERELWRAVFDGGRAAWPVLRTHLIAAHRLRVRPNGRD